MEGWPLIALIELELQRLAHLLPQGEAGAEAAEAWTGEGFGPSDVRAWIEAGCWSPDAAAFLRHHGAGVEAARVEVDGRSLGALLSAGEIESVEAIGRLAQIDALRGKMESVKMSKINDIVSLCDALNDDTYDGDLSDCPTFGGEEVEAWSRGPVWSWDEEDVLVGNSPFEVISREEYTEWLLLGRRHWN